MRKVRTFSPRLAVGLIIMGLGTLFLLDNLDLLAFDDAIRWWPLAPIAIGLALVLPSGGSGNRGFGLFLIGAGVWALLHELELVDWDLGDIFPFLLIAVGAWMVWRALSGDDSPPSSRPDSVSHFVGPSGGFDSSTAPGFAGAEAAYTSGAEAAYPGAEAAQPGADAAHFTDADAGGSSAYAASPGTGEDTLSAFGFLGHVEKSTGSQRFLGADLTAIMGGCTIDLRSADIGPEPAVIDAFAFWGGIEIVVPEDWEVTNKVLPLLGSAEDTTRSPAGGTKLLLVRGTSMMAGVEITNEPSED